eukprot:5629388-Prymnesium_polylepis.1
MVAAGELPPDATEEERAAAKQKIQASLAADVGHVLDAAMASGRSKASMPLEEAWARLCALADADDLEGVL